MTSSTEDSCREFAHAENRNYAWCPIFSNNSLSNHCVEWNVCKSKPIPSTLSCLNDSWVIFQGNGACSSKLFILIILFCLFCFVIAGAFLYICYKCRRIQRNKREKEGEPTNFIETEALL